jgi:hypothetical protein
MRGIAPGAGSGRGGGADRGSPEDVMRAVEPDADAGKAGTGRGSPEDAIRGVAPGADAGRDGAAAWPPRRWAAGQPAPPTGSRRPGGAGGGGRHRVALALLVVGLAVAAGPLLPAGTAQAAPDCVALVVDPAPGGANTGCVTWAAGITGVQVLQRAGHSLQFRPTDGLLCRIDGVPSTCRADATHYWSYWHRAPGGSGWTYSTQGAGSYQPPRNSTEGWAYLDGASRPPANIAFSTICPPPAAPPRPPPAAPRATSTRTTSSNSAPAAAPARTAGRPPDRPATGATTRSADSRSAPAAPAHSTKPGTATNSAPAAAKTASATLAAPTDPTVIVPVAAEDRGGGPPIGALIGLVLVAAVAGVGVWFARTRRTRAP